MFKGSMVAIVTPLRKDEFDRESFRKLVEFQISNGTSGIVPCGCMGEPATLIMDEHMRVIEYAVEIVNKRVPVIAGTGSNSTAEAIDLTLCAEKAGADAVLLITPYYNKPTQKGLYEHYKKISESTTIPIILYNVPSRTGISIFPETVAKLSELDNIVAIKEASGSLDQVSKILSLCGSNLTVLSGDDSLTVPMMSIGAKGVISVAANIVPDKVSAMVEAALKGDFKKAAEIHIQLLPIFKALFIETNPIPVKAALGLMGMLSPEWRLPLTPPSKKNLEIIKNVLQSNGVIT